MEKKITPITICIDFDGTCVTHEFPKVGKDIGAVPVLKKLIESGHQLVLFTMRSDIVNPTGEDNELHLESGNYLTDAVNWFKENEIPLYGIQTNPTQHTWTTSPKAYAQLYIDDAALGCPLLYGNFGENGEGFYFDKPQVDWEKVKDILIKNGIINV
ncbi:MAG TPA: hypothetical protein PKN53_09235 [Bacteroidales bacterium]|jgi:hypothetical protein|nr:hypothetical protein [Bacteroidales bacterium]